MVSLLSAEETVCSRRWVACFSVVIAVHRQDGALERVFKACFHRFAD